MKKLPFYLGCMCIVFLSNIITLQAQSCENRCLRFDGNDDFISANPPGVSGNPDFTFECWFSATPTTGICPDNFKKIFSLASSNTFLRFEMGVCEDQLILSWNSNFCDNLFQNISFISTNVFHHLAVTRSGANIEIYLDCLPVYSSTFCGAFNFSSFLVGHSNLSAPNNENWIGYLDDIRLWDYPRTLTEIEEQKHCVLSGDETGLELYWTFDQGVAGADNTTTVLQVDDTSPNANHGTLNGFALTGTLSNIACSDAALVYPNFQNLEFSINEYLNTTSPLTEICNGDPVHFDLYHNGQVLPPLSTVTIDWQCLDGNNWISLPDPPFIGYNFGVPPETLTLDCSNSTDGFIDKLYRAVTTVTDPALGLSCDYISETYEIRICCPISPATVVISPGDVLCEGDVIDFTVELISPDLFVMTAGPEVDITWCLNGNPIGNLDQTNFTYTATASVPGLCFEAKVTNCNNKLATFSTCITVDPEPKCGSITGLANPATLTQDLLDPNLYYICPGNDAALGENPTDLFEDCIPQWQYSFTGTDPWTNLGTSNTVQNTNILPSDLWPNNAISIYYRVQCNPYSNPSGCDPCYSNTIEIQLMVTPPNDIVYEETLVCDEDDFPVFLYLGAPNSDYTYTWVHDGYVIGTGWEWNATAPGCYWVEISNGCQVTTTPPACIELCELIPVISCPLPPNECACAGDPITLTAIASESSCGDNSGFEYYWFVNSVQQPETIPPYEFTHTPATTGTTYQLSILDTSTGCWAITSTFIKPCDKQ